MFNGRVFCAVTGAHGYIGSAICAQLEHAGFHIAELSRNGQPSQPQRQAAVFQLGSQVDPAIFRDVDVLVHCAYDFVARSWKQIERVNVKGTEALLKAAHAGGVQRMIVISTISAFEGCRSLYGRAKLAIEREAAAYDAVIVRPGLVYDAVAPRGVVGALAQVVNRSPLVPVVGGRSVLYPCHIDDLTRLVDTLCMHPVVPTGTPIIGASAHGMTFRAVLGAIARERSRAPLFVPVPALPILWGLRLAEALGVRTRLRSDSLVSLLHQNTSADFRASFSLGVPFRPLVPARTSAETEATP